MLASFWGTFDRLRPIVGVNFTRKYWKLAPVNLIDKTPVIWRVYVFAGKNFQPEHFSNASRVTTVRIPFCLRQYTEHVDLWWRFVLCEKLFDSTYRSVGFRCFRGTTTVGRRCFRFVHVLSARRDYRRPDARPENTFLSYFVAGFHNPTDVVPTKRKSDRKTTKNQQNPFSSVRSSIHFVFTFQINFSWLSELNGGRNAEQKTN